MSPAIFADTFYWVALTDPADAAHRQALNLTSNWIDSPIVKTEGRIGHRVTEGTEREI